jgi:hypothetical protein
LLVVSLIYATIFSGRPRWGTEPRKTRSQDRQQVIRHSGDIVSQPRRFMRAFGRPSFESLENSMEPSPIFFPRYVMIREGDQRGEHGTRSETNATDPVPRSEPWRTGPR